MTEAALPEALAGLRVVEWTDELGAWAGKLMADMGAEVVKIEPPDGDPTRRFGPFVDDQPDPEASLWFWNYNTNKKSVTLDLESDRARSIFRDLVATADVVLESQPRERPGRLGIDYEDLKAEHPRLIWASVTPYGRNGPRADDPATDLTLLAGGGIAWMNGYDDHSIPPVRGGGNQAYHTGSHYAFMGVLVALLDREVSGRGQFVEINTNAAINVTTEAGSYSWLVAQQTVQRQTGRHAMVQSSLPNQLLCADGKHINIMLTARKPETFVMISDWMASLDLADQVPELVARVAAGDINPLQYQDVRGLISATKDALVLIAAKVPARDFMMHTQRHGVVCSVINSPDEMIENEHFVARGFPTPVEHPEMGRTVTYGGAPYHFEKTPWRIKRRPPFLGEHNAEVYESLGLSTVDIAALKKAGVV